MAEIYPPKSIVICMVGKSEKLKIGDFLVEKGIIDYQQAKCPFCNRDTETNSHILFTCSFSWISWMQMLKWWNISGVLHNRCKNFNIEWFGMLKCRKYRTLWGLILGCVIWSLWYERNKRKFEYTC